MDSYDSPNAAPATPSAHLPITLFAFALCVFFLIQILDSGVDAEMLGNQRKSLATFTTDLEKQLATKKEDQKDRQEQTAVAQKQQEANDDAKKEAKEVEGALKAAARMKQLNQQLADATKTYNDQKPLIEQTSKLEKQSTDIIQAIEALAKGGDEDAKALMELVARAGINVQKPEDAKPGDKPADKPADTKPN